MALQRLDSIRSSQSYGSESKGSFAPNTPEEVRSL